MAGHPPFRGPGILNGHEHVACASRAAGVAFAKEGNCFTAAPTPRLAQFADTLSQPAAIGRLGQVCDRWVYSACLCFGLDVADQERSRFVYGYAVNQVEYSRNLLPSGAQMEATFDAIVDRTHRRLDVPALRTLFGNQKCSAPTAPRGSARVAAVTETPEASGLTIFKVQSPRAGSPKGYTGGEHVLRFEAGLPQHQSPAEGAAVLDRFPDILAARLAGMLEGAFEPFP